MFSPNSRACEGQLAHAPLLYGVTTISMLKSKFLVTQSLLTLNLTMAGIQTLDRFLS